MLPLVFVNALHLYIEHRVRIQHDARALARDRRQVALVRALDVSPALLKRTVVGEPLQLAQPLEVAHPALADRIADEAGEAGIGQSEPASRGDAVGLVAEFLGSQVVEILQHVLFQQLRMQGRDTIDRVASHAREVRHAHIARSALVDQRHARDPLVISEEAQPYFVQETRVDFVHDLQMPRQDLAEHRQ